MKKVILSLFLGFGVFLVCQNDSFGFGVELGVDCDPNQIFVSVPCVDAENFGVGPHRARICGAPGCGWYDLYLMPATGTCEWCLDPL